MHFAPNLISTLAIPCGPSQPDTERARDVEELSTLRHAALLPE